MNYSIFGPFIEIVGIGSTHFVKYSMVIIINLYPPKEIGDIWAIKSNAHIENGHNDCMGCNACDGLLNKFEFYWNLTHFFYIFDTIMFPGGTIISHMH